MTNKNMSDGFIVMDPSEIARLVEFRNELNKKQNKYLQAAKHCETERNKIDEILKIQCKHKGVPDYTVVGERISYICSVCGIYI